LQLFEGSDIDDLDGQIDHQYINFVEHFFALKIDSQGPKIENSSFKWIMKDRLLWNKFVKIRNFEIFDPEKFNKLPTCGLSKLVSFSEILIPNGNSWTHLP